jgi:hypothetical protein
MSIGKVGLKILLFLVRKLIKALAIVVFPEPKLPLRQYISSDLLICASLFPNLIVSSILFNNIFIILYESTPNIYTGLV